MYKLEHSTDSMVESFFPDIDYELEITEDMIDDELEQMREYITMLVLMEKHIYN